MRSLILEQASHHRFQRAASRNAAETRAQPDGKINDALAPRLRHRLVTDMLPRECLRSCNSDKVPPRP